MAKKNSKAPIYFMVRFGKLIEEFHSEAAHFTQIMTNGGGIRTLGMLDVIRRMESLYIQIAAHLDAAKDLNGGSGITLDDALDALEIARALEQEDTATSAEN